MPTCFLVDNGSLRADAWRNLRRLAAGLSDRTGMRVEAASLLHSDRIPVEDLGCDAPGRTLERMVRAFLEAGERDFLILPLFFGPSRAITRYLPTRFGVVRQELGPFRWAVAPFLFEEEELSEGLTSLLVERVGEVLEREGLERPPVILVDHGSPVRAVATVRDTLAARLSGALGDRVRQVVPASMERREDDRYAFCDPLLEVQLDREGFCEGPVVVAMLFLGPGRHAGEGGDVDRICRAAEERHPALRVFRTRLLATSDDLYGLLERRLEAGLGLLESQASGEVSAAG